MPRVVGEKHQASLGVVLETGHARVGRWILIQRPVLYIDFVCPVGNVVEAGISAQGGLSCGPRIGLLLSTRRQFV